MTKEEAVEKALNARPGMKVDRITEHEKCFVISLVPKDFKKGNYISGATRVDKKTGEVRLYNPMIENLR